MRRGRFGCPPAWLSPCGHRCLAVPPLPEGTLGHGGQEKKPLLPHPCPCPIRGAPLLPQPVSLHVVGACGGLGLVPSRLCATPHGDK